MMTSIISADQEIINTMKNLIKICPSSMENHIQSRLHCFLYVTNIVRSKINFDDKLKLGIFHQTINVQIWRVIRLRVFNQNVNKVLVIM